MAIPTVDLSPFLMDGDEDARKKAADVIKEACSDSGSFQITNHGIPLHLIAQSIQLSRTFFALPHQEKLKHSCSSSSEPFPPGFPPGYSTSNDIELFYMHHPQSSSYISPQSPPNLGNVLEEIFESLTRIGEVIEGIVNDCLGLPTNFLKEYNDDRSSDALAVVSFSPATEADDDGAGEHTDSIFMTLVVQDEVGGLEVKTKDGKWVPVVPAQGAIVVKLGDVIQVLSNKKFKSAVHRVVRPKERRRQSVVLSFKLDGEKWVEPLLQFTAEIGEVAEYKGFVYKEYEALKLSNA